VLRPVLVAVAATAVAAATVAACSASPAPPVRTGTPSVQGGVPGGVQGGTASVRGGAPADAQGGTLVATPAEAVTGPTVTANGHGTASGTPDLLTVTLGVQTNGPTAHGILETNNAEAAAMIAKLRADGVAAADIQTVQLGLSPTYSADRISGYQATDTVTVRLHQLDRAGTVIDDAVAAGGGDSQVQSVSYSVADPGPLLAAAHADAVHEAVAEAKAMAAAAGVSLGALRAVSDASPPQVLPFAGAVPAMSAAAGPAAVPVQAGTEQVTADVTVSYAVA
jgi:uncharacterized protein YggE